MDQSISEAFAQTGTDTINHRGRIVKAVVRLPVRDQAVVNVTRLGVGAPRPQALKLAVNAGVLVVNGQRSQAVALWSDTSPKEVSLMIEGESASTLEVWNAWSMGGVDTSWIGNAGIVTKAKANGTSLRCSDGIGPAEFSDLEVDIAVERPGKI